MHPAHHPRRRLIILGLLVGVAAGFAAWDPLFNGLDRLPVETEPFMLRHKWAGAAIFTGLATISAFMAFFSSTLLVPVAVHAWGEPLTNVLLWSRWMVGGCVAYGIGRSLGRPVARYLASAERLTYYEEQLRRRAPFGLVILLHLALQLEIPGLVLGLLRYRFGRFSLALGLAEIPYAVGVVYLSRIFLERQVGLASAGAIGVAVYALHTLHRAIDSGDRAVT